jgi:hypothetical protein
VTLELEKAVEKGYIIGKVYEVYHWKEYAQYDPVTGRSGLFDQYTNLFLKLKQESSGWPSWVKTEEQKKSYICDYAEHESVNLRESLISHNPGLIALAKLCLNSFWGYFVRSK